MGKIFESILAVIICVPVPGAFLPRCMECRRGLAMRIPSVCPLDCLRKIRGVGWQKKDTGKIEVFRLRRAANERRNHHRKNTNTTASKSCLHAFIDLNSGV